MNNTDINMPVAKASAAAASAVAAQIIDGPILHFSDLFTLTWPNIAAFAAALYTSMMIIEFAWRKFIRPFFEAYGMIKVKPRKVYTAREWADKIAEQDSASMPLR